VRIGGGGVIERNMIYIEEGDIYILKECKSGEVEDDEEKFKTERGGREMKMEKDSRKVIISRIECVYIYILEK
jgi:hypothetical protein